MQFQEFQQARSQKMSRFVMTLYMYCLLLVVMGQASTGFTPEAVCFLGGREAPVRGVVTLKRGSFCMGQRVSHSTRSRCGAGPVEILNPSNRLSGQAVDSDVCLWRRRRHGVRRMSILASVTDAPSMASGKAEFSLRRARPHELDLLAILSTEAFTPRGEWYDVVQRVKFLLVRWDLQAQFHQRFYHWSDVAKDFKPPVLEARYALLAAAKANGNAIGVTELCVAPNPASKEFSEEQNLRTCAPYLSNLAVDAKFRRKGIGQGLVRWCEQLSAEWGHNVLFLHVDISNESAIKFYRSLGFVEAPRDMAWYDRIGRQDLQVDKQMLLVKTFDATPALEQQSDDDLEDTRLSQ